MALRTFITRLRLRIRARFVLVLGLLVLGTSMLGAVALIGLSDLRESNAGLREAVGDATLDGDVLADLILFGAQIQQYVGAR